ncbi:response regulator [Oxalobacteraceae sp. CFBP 8761]|nr:response regulator [Oxalobacteraceae sp. CFBP 8761]
MKNILLVDDLGIDVMLTRLALQEFAFDHELVVAGDGAQAYEMLRQQRFDLLLLDIKMPQVDGFELLALLRTESLAGMPVIIVSGSGLAADRERAQALGVDDYVQKAVDYTGFKRELKAALVRQGCPAG